MKYFLSTLFGLIVGLVSIIIFVYLSTLIFPLPDGIELFKLESIKENLDLIPNPNLAMIVLAYAVASFVAGLSSVRIETTRPRIPLIIIGVLLTASGFVTFILIPYPLWVLVVGSFAFYPLTQLGGTTGLGRPL